jgi:MoaA/NifB/PqqE/SkfB family radical SAM enzyme
MEINSGLEIGLAFVWSNENTDEIFQSILLGRNLGIDNFFITGLEAYTPAQADKIPYLSKNQNKLITRLEELSNEVIIEGSLTNPTSLCPFAENGEIALRWDGEISPCLPLLYDHSSILGNWTRQIYSYSLGNLADRSLQEIWDDQAYTSLRKKLLEDDFSPCLHCRDCWLSDDNLLDCMGYEHPTCGGCLWAHGLIACPQ